MRGKRQGGGMAALTTGITPAHAGKTGPYDCNAADRGDHPRACGENLGRLLLPFEGLGSPPRMRGKHRRHFRIKWGDGITPAHAGKTRIRAASAAWVWDHPRACGENISSSCSFQSFPGSPPRMRGKRPECAESTRAGGITPAHAGKTVVDKPFNGA